MVGYAEILGTVFGEVHSCGICGSGMASAAQDNHTAARAAGGCVVQHYHDNAISFCVLHESSAAEYPGAAVDVICDKVLD